MKNRNVVFIETSSRLVPRPSEVAHTQLLPSSNATDAHNYTTDDDFLRGLRDYTSVLARTPYQCFCGPHNRRRALSEPTGGRTLGSDQRHHPEGYTGRRNRRIAARGVYIRGTICEGRPRRRHYKRWNIPRGSSAGGRSRTSGATNITGGSLPGIFVCCIIAALTKGALAPGSDSCGYACWYCSKILLEA